MLQSGRRMDPVDFSSFQPSVMSLCLPAGNQFHHHQQQQQESSFRPYPPTDLSLFPPITDSLSSSGTATAGTAPVKHLYAQHQNKLSINGKSQSLGLVGNESSLASTGSILKTNAFNNSQNKSLAASMLSSSSSPSSVSPSAAVAAVAAAAGHLPHWFIQQQQQQTATTSATSRKKRRQFPSESASGTSQRDQAANPPPMF